MAKHTLDSVIKEYLILKGDTTQSSYFKILSIALSSLRELEMDVKGNIKTVELDIESNGTVLLPRDFMDYVKVAVCMNGCLYEMGRNKNLCLDVPKDDCGNESPKSENEGDYIITSGYTNSRNGEYLGRSYGIGGGNNAIGNYRVDEDNQRIVLSLAKRSETSGIVLEYLADPSLCPEEHEVHSYNIEAMKAFMYWKDISMNRKVAVSEKAMAKQEYIKQKNMAKRRHKSFTLQDAKEVTRRHVKGSPRL